MTTERIVLFAFASITYSMDGWATAGTEERFWEGKPVEICLMESRCDEREPEVCLMDGCAFRAPFIEPAAGHLDIYRR